MEALTMREMLTRYRKWLVALIVLLVVAVVTAALRTEQPPAPKTEADQPTESEVTFDMEKNRAYTAEDGIVVIPASLTDADPPADSPTVASVSLQATSAAVDSTKPKAVTVDNTAYTLPEQVQMADGSIGLLTIPALSLSVSVYETEDEMEAMNHGVAHFKTTSSWEGNVGLCSHNVNFDLTDGYFKYIHTLKEGDAINYATALGSRAYTVVTVAEIAENDWSYLGRTEDNRLTLITCISGKPRSRLVVQAVAA
jgi:LPXTG-site transpeptidase (sortase) family protein